MFYRWQECGILGAVCRKCHKICVKAASGVISSGVCGVVFFVFDFSVAQSICKATEY